MFEFGDRAEDLEEHPAHGSGGVDPLVQHDEVDPAGLQQLREFDQVLERTAEPVELGDDQLVTRAVGGQKGLVQLGASRELARRLVGEDLLAAGGGERVVLRFGVLVASGDSLPLADPHPPDRNVNPRRRDIAAYTASVTTPRQLRRGFSRRPGRVSRTIVRGQTGRYHRVARVPATFPPSGDG